MLELIEDLPEDVLGIEAKGKVTHADYRDVLIPKVETMMAKGPVKILYVIGPDSEGFELEAMWDDASLGMRHLGDFGRIAVVTDASWMRAAISMFAPLFGAKFQLFKVSDLPAAKTWIASS